MIMDLGVARFRASNREAGNELVFLIIPGWETNGLVSKDIAAITIR
jgi:hypothetical protein